MKMHVRSTTLYYVNMNVVSLVMMTYSLQMSNILFVLLDRYN